jgi:hypothetical protein
MLRDKKVVGVFVRFRAPQNHAHDARFAEADGHDERQAQNQACESRRCERFIRDTRQGEWSKARRLSSYRR